MNCLSSREQADAIRNHIRNYHDNFLLDLLTQIDRQDVDANEIFLEAIKQELLERGVTFGAKTG